MPNRFSKADSRELRRLAGVVYERELSKELTRLLDRFKQWDVGELDPFALNDDIHSFHDGTSRDLYKFYTMVPPQNAVAYGLAEKLLTRDEVPQGLLAKLELSIDFYAGEKVADDDTVTADNMEEMDVHMSVDLDETDITREVSQSLLRERILHLRGDFGDPALGFPIEVDILNIETDGDNLGIRVFNRGITLGVFNDEGVRRLHRFFGTLRAAEKG